MPKQNQTEQTLVFHGTVTVTIMHVQNWKSHQTQKGNGMERLVAWFDWLMSYNCIEILYSTPQKCRTSVSYLNFF